MKLIDLDHDKLRRRLEKIYDVAARIAIKYGKWGRNFLYTDRQIAEFWVEEKDIRMPSEYFLKEMVNISTVKWIIHDKITYDDPIWTSDFLHGMTVNGSVRWNSRSFPTFYLYNNRSLEDIIKISPFGGDLNENKRWCYVPALCLKYSDKSTSFMAGALSGGTLVDIDGVTHASYNHRMKDWFIKWGIPIERMYAKKVYISPLWPAILTPWMPIEVREKWTTIKKPVATDIYCPVLWRIYVDSKFPTLGIPYLKSRRRIFYQYGKGAMKVIERLRVSMGLTMLDNRLSDAVKKWSRNEVPTD